MNLIGKSIQPRKVISITTSKSVHACNSGNKRNTAHHRQFGKLKSLTIQHSKYLFFHYFLCVYILLLNKKNLCFILCLFFLKECIFPRH